MRVRSGRVISIEKAPVVFLLTILLVTAGCAARYVVISPLGEPLSGYSALAIGEIVDALPESVPGEDRPDPEIVGKLRAFLAEAIEDKGLFSYILTDAPSSPEQAPALMLSGRIVSYKAGSRAARYFVGFGAGKGELVVELTLRDTERGEDLFVGNFKGEVSGGLFGGSSDQPLKEISSEFAKYLKKNWE